MLKPGEIVDGRYQVIRELADGGMGTVFLAEHSASKRKIALKVLHADLAHDATILRRFMNEALAAGQIGHPNIVDSIDVGSVHGLPYIVFEYLEGTGLSDELVRIPVFPVARAVDIARQIAGALEAAHAAGIIHRDLKTDNIFLLRPPASTRDFVKVLDFGISRFLTATDKTAVGASVMGTPEFMAPEQLLTPDTIDHRVDIYALGVVLYEMLTDGVPFAPDRRGPLATFEETEQLFDRVLNEKPPAITRPDVPRELAQLIEVKLLAKVPKWRCASMAEVERELAAIAVAL